ncbi:hypothetical protein V8F06_007195 [Rhypophila decipiens]
MSARTFLAGILELPALLFSTSLPPSRVPAITTYQGDTLGSCLPSKKRLAVLYYVLYASTYISGTISPFQVVIMAHPVKLIIKCPFRILGLSCLHESAAATYLDLDLTLQL